MSATHSESSYPQANPSSSTSSTYSHTAFFYGTLMAPQVLHRVCHGGMDPLNPIYSTHNFRIRPALLQNFRRHRVKAADYPAILHHEEACVRGTLVTGLTDADLWRLDVFEGDEYQRQNVNVRVLSDGSSEDEGADAKEITAETYVWVAGESRLEEREWDFDEFRREKMRNWVGIGGEAEYAEVDEAVAKDQDATGGRGRNGAISERLEEERRKEAKEVLNSAV